MQEEQQQNETFIEPQKFIHLDQIPVPAYCIECGAFVGLKARSSLTAKQIKNDHALVLCETRMSAADGFCQK